MLLHGYLPNEFISSDIIPVIKNKTGDTSDKGSYQPIAIVLSCLKILESILLDMIDDYLVIHEHQFGF